MPKKKKHELFFSVLNTLEHGPEKPATGGGTKYVLKVCPFCERKGSAAVFCSEEGYGFSCKGCADDGNDYHWKDLREKQGFRTAPYGLTLSQYADLTKVPLDFLKSVFHLEDGFSPEPYHTPCVWTPYANGSRRYRVGYKTGKKERFWEGKAGLYGLPQLEAYAKVRPPGAVIIVEGESDTEALCFNGFPVVGIPGVDCVRATFDPDLPVFNNAPFYVHMERDKKTAKTSQEVWKFVQTIADLCEPGRVRGFELPGKSKIDPSSLWVQLRERLSEEEAAPLFREAILGCMTNVSDIILPKNAKVSDVPVTAEAEAAKAIQSLYNVEFIDLENEEEEGVEFLWPDVLPRDELIVFQGISGVGKTPAIIDLVARITTGADFPSARGGELFAKNGNWIQKDGQTVFVPEPRAPESVLLFAGEDRIKSVVLPRLRVAGADLKRVHPVKTLYRKDDKTGESIAEVTPESIRAALAERPAKFIVIDPLGDYLDARTDPNKEQHMRPLLRKLQNLCREEHINILYVIHLNKKTELSVSDRGAGARAMLAVPRVSYNFSFLPEESTESEKHSRIRAMSRIRNSHVGEDIPATLKFKTVAEPREIKGKIYPIVKIEWLGTDERGAEELMQSDGRGRKGPKPVATERAEAWLLDFLKDGPKLASSSDKLEPDSVFGEGDRAHHAFTTINEASARLGTVEKLKGRNLGAGFAANRTYWRLSPHKRCPLCGEHHPDKCTRSGGLSGSGSRGGLHVVPTTPST